MKSEGLPEDVRVNVATGRRTGVVLAVSGGEEWAQSRLLTPAEARVLAAHLWRAANEAEGVADWLPDLIVKRLLDPPPASSPGKESAPLRGSRASVAGISPGNESGSAPPPAEAPPFRGILAGVAAADLEPVAADPVFDDAPPPRWGAMHMKGR
jgi:hypothetical protein